MASLILVRHRTKEVARVSIKNNWSHLIRVWSFSSCLFALLVSGVGLKNGRNQKPRLVTTNENIADQSKKIEEK